MESFVCWCQFQLGETVKILSCIEIVHSFRLISILCTYRMYITRCQVSKIKLCVFILVSEICYRWRRNSCKKFALIALQRKVKAKLGQECRQWTQMYSSLHPQFLRLSVTMFQLPRRQVFCLPFKKLLGKPREILSPV
jgi:hypothetical protein